jgi:hypothetical protein
MIFEIFSSQSGDKFYFRLKTDDGNVVLSSQGYASKDSCKNGTTSVKNNAGEDDNYEIKQSSNGKWFYNLLAKNKQVIGTSQMFDSEEAMEAERSATKQAAAATVVDLT